MKRDKLSEWEKSSQTRTQFCKEKGLSLHTFPYWRTQVGKSSKTKEMELRI